MRWDTEEIGSTMLTREPLDAVVGLIVGALFGATSGLGLGLYAMPGTLLFTGGTMVFGAIVCAVLGYYKGDDFFRWLRDHWFD